MQTLIKTITGENAEVFAVKNGQRAVIGKCSAAIYIYEHSSNVPILGQGHRIKTAPSADISCSEIELTREVDEAYLQNISRFEIKADVQRPDGIFERFIFDNLSVNEIDICGDWDFGIVPYETVKRLMEI